MSTTPLNIGDKRFHKSLRDKAIFSKGGRIRSKVRCSQPEFHAPNLLGVAPTRIFVMGKCDSMTSKKPSTHALFLKCGRFEAGAHGLPAVTLLALLAAALMLWLAIT